MGLLQAIFANNGTANTFDDGNNEISEPFTCRVWGPDQSVPVLIDGTFRYWKIKRFTAPGAGTTVRYTLRKNGVATALVINISDTNTTGEDLSNSATFAKNDQVDVLCTHVTGSPALSGINSYIEFEGQNNTDSIYGCSASSDQADLDKTGIFNGPSAWDNDSTLVRHVVPISGTLVESRAYGDTFPSGGQSIEFTIYKNGVKQDGSGGTIDTRCIISGGVNTASKIYELPLSIGDLVYAEVDYVGGAGTSRMRAGFRFRASTAHQFVIAGMSPTNTGAGTIDFPFQSNVGTNVLIAEATQQSIAGPSAFRLFNFHGVLTAAPGGGKSRLVNARKNLANAGPTLFFDASDTVKSDLVNTFSLQGSDAGSIQSILTASPTAANFSYSFGAILGSVPANPIPFMTTIGMMR